MQSIKFKLGFLLLASSMVLPSCGDSPDRLEISPTPPSRLSKDLQSCQDGKVENRRESVAVTGVEICEFKVSEENGQVVGLYTKGLLNSNYQISYPKDESVKVDLTVDIQFPETISADDKTKITEFIYSNCFDAGDHEWGDIKSIWKRSEINLSLNFMAYTAEAATNPLLKLQNLAAADAKPHLVLSLFPDRSSLYPFGNAKCEELCPLAGGTRDQACWDNCLREESDPFCRSLAKMTGHWMGLEDHSTANQCLAVGEVNQGQRESVFMRGWTPGAEDEVVQIPLTLPPSTEVVQATPDPAANPETPAQESDSTSPETQVAEADPQTLPLETDSASQTNQTAAVENSTNHVEVAENSTTVSVVVTPEGTTVSETLSERNDADDEDREDSEDGLTPNHLKDGYWLESRVSTRDLAKILAPLCPDLKD